MRSNVKLTSKQTFQNRLQSYVGITPYLEITMIVIPFPFSHKSESDSFSHLNVILSSRNQFAEVIPCFPIRLL